MNDGKQHRKANPTSYSYRTCRVGLTDCREQFNLARSLGVSPPPSDICGDYPSTASPPLINSNSIDIDMIRGEDGQQFLK
jgi:hypothetical protein